MNRRRAIAASASTVVVLAIVGPATALDWRGVPLRSLFAERSRAASAEQLHAAIPRGTSSLKLDSRLAGITGRE